MNSNNKNRHSLARRLIALGSLIAAMSAVPVPAFAQDTEASGDGTDQSVGGRLTLGVGAAYGSSYEGSRDSRTRALPFFDYRNGGFFAGLRGIGYGFKAGNAFEYGPRVTLRPGRDENDSEALRGLGDIRRGGEAGGFVRWKPAPFFVELSLSRGFDRIDGTRARLSGGWSARRAREMLLLSATIDWADSTIMNTWYGINELQASRSGLPVYSADDGLRSFGINLIWTHAFSRSAFSTLGVHARQLADEAANSPISTRRSSLGISAGVGYRF